MVCEKNTEEKLQELLDGQLGLQESSKVRAHLQQCPGFRVYFRNLQIIGESLRRLPLLQPGPAFNQKVMAALGNASLRVFPLPWQRWAAGSFLLAVCAWIAGIGLFLRERLSPFQTTRVFELILHPSRLWDSLQLSALKGFLGSLHLLKGVEEWSFLFSPGIQETSFWLQVVLSGLLAAVFIWIVSAKTGPTDLRRTA